MGIITDAKEGHEKFKDPASCLGDLMGTEQIQVIKDCPSQGTMQAVDEGKEDELGKGKKKKNDSWWTFENI